MHKVAFVFCILLFVFFLTPYNIFAKTVPICTNETVAVDRFPRTTTSPGECPEDSPGANYVCYINGVDKYNVNGRTNTCYREGPSPVAPIVAQEQSRTAEVESCEIVNRFEPTPAVINKKATAILKGAAGERFITITHPGGTQIIQNQRIANINPDTVFTLPTPDINGAGEWTLTITDGSNCQTDYNYTVQRPPAYECNRGQGPGTNCNLASDTKQTIGGVCYCIPQGGIPPPAPAPAAATTITTSKDKCIPDCPTGTNPGPGDQCFAPGDSRPLQPSGSACSDPNLVPSDTNISNILNCFCGPQAIPPPTGGAITTTGGNACVPILLCKAGTLNTSTNKCTVSISAPGAGGVTQTYDPVPTITKDSCPAGSCPNSLDRATCSCEPSSTGKCDPPGTGTKCKDGGVTSLCADGSKPGTYNGMCGNGERPTQIPAWICDIADTCASSQDASCTCIPKDSGKCADPILKPRIPGCLYKDDPEYARLIAAGSPVPNFCPESEAVRCKLSDGSVVKIQPGVTVPEGVGVMTAIGCIPTEPKALVESVLRYATLASGGIALLLMILASLQMITAEGNPESIKKGQEKFYSAIIGLLLIIFSVLLLQVVGVDILGLPGFGR